MKAAIYNPEAKETNFLSIEEVPKPMLTENNAIIRVEAVGVCGSDLLKLNRALVKPGMVLGHEMLGTIEEIAESTSKKYNLKIGDRIVSSHHVPCGLCDYCLNQQESLCTKFKSSNFNPGAFCEYLELSEDHLKHTVQKIPEGLSDEEISFTEPLACCIKAIEKSDLKNRKGNSAKVLVIGLGSIGLMLGQLTKYYKKDFVVCGLDLINSRLELASRLGFDQVSKSLNELNSSTYNYIFLAAGANISVDLAIQAAANGATIIVFASVSDELKGFANNDIYYKELNILGSYSPNLSNLYESLELIKNQSITVKDLITHKTNLENLGMNIKKLHEDQGIKLLLSLN